jgi:hypothetical protein
LKALSVGLLGTIAVMALGLVPRTGAEPVRFAQFNIWELSRAKLDELDAAGRGASPQLQKAAEILQHLRPDVLLINEIDFDPGEGRNLQLFQERYLGVPQGGQPPLRYAHAFFAPVNTGVATGLDLDNDGTSEGPGDGFGFGRYPGQYGMGLLSRYPIDEERVRTFRKLLWKQMPGHLIPDGQEGRPEWYTSEEVQVLRLSSKSHWDIPLEIGGHTVYVLCAHPTPPIFDGPEDHNGRRNFDEIRLLADYIAGGERADYIVDDSGRPGGLGADALFVVMGDMNADPLQDPGPYGMPAISQILSLKRVQDPIPTSAGAVGDAQAGPPDHPERRTADFGRIDYVLPSIGLEVVGRGVFWPAVGDPLRTLVEEPEPASDHRLVWVDVRLP